MKTAAAIPHTVATRLDDAVLQGRRGSATGLLERGFARMFRGLVYAQIWEDPVADMAALGIREGDNLVCIASGGCNVMSYLTARPGSIAAVDLSPAHVALLRLKLAAAAHLERHADFFALFGRGDLAGNVGLYDRCLAPHLDGATRAFWETRSFGRRQIEMVARGLTRHGVLGRFLGLTGIAARLLGVDFAPLLSARSLDEQRRFFDRRIAPVFDHRLVRFLARRRLTLFGLGIPPAQHSRLAADGGGDIVPVLRERVRKLMCDFPASGNYFLSQACCRRYSGSRGAAVPPYLDPEAFATLKERAGCVQVRNESVTELLSARPAGSVDCVVLLDAQDWMTGPQLDALWTEITRTARPRARVLFRTGGAADIVAESVAPAIRERWEYDRPASEAAFAADRSAIYGGVHLYSFRG